MLTIIHGEQIVASRTKLVELLEEIKRTNKQIFRLDAKHLDRSQLESALGAQDLFGEERVVVIEGLHSLPRSAKKTELLDMVATAQVSTILWEQRELTKTMLKPFANAQVYYFKLSKSTFAWLDSLQGDGKQREKSVKMFHESLTQEDEYFLLLMFIRQIRLLIQAKDGGVIKAAPFVVSKLMKQASTFSLAKLLSIHSKLLEIDLKQKTSTNALSLEQELDLLLLDM